MIELNVPYKEKDIAKKLGAKWNPNKKFWYIPENKYDILDEFKKWINSNNITDAFIMNGKKYLIKSESSCWKCGEISDVIALGVDGIYNEPANYLSIISNLSFISGSIIDKIVRLFPSYKLDYSNTLKYKYYMNHCKSCGAKQGDFFMHSEPGGAFSPVEDSDFEKIEIFELDKNLDYIFIGSVGYVSSMADYYDNLDNNFRSIEELER